MLSFTIGSYLRSYYNSVSCFIKFEFGSLSFCHKQVVFYDDKEMQLDLKNPTKIYHHFQFFFNLFSFTVFNNIMLD